MYFIHILYLLITEGDMCTNYCRMRSTHFLFKGSGNRIADNIYVLKCHFCFATATKPLLQHYQVSIMFEMNWKVHIPKPAFIKDRYIYLYIYSALVGPCAPRAEDSEPEDFRVVK